MAGFVDEVRGDHAVRAGHHLVEERRGVAVGRVGRQHACDEALAQRLGVGGEALRRAVAVAVEAVGHHGEVLALHAFAHGGQFLRRDVQAGRVVQRQGRLRQHRRQHRWLQHHREREVAGEAHADGADARPAAFLVSQPRQRAQPLRDRARFVGREGTELGAHAGSLEHGDAFVDLRHGAIAPEQRGHVDAEARIAHPAGEARDLRADAGHLGHHDHRRAPARHVHHLVDSVQHDLAMLEVIERVVFV